MSAPTLKTSRPSHETILSIPPNSGPLTPALLRRYYHSALLRHHPDKAQNGKVDGNTTEMEKTVRAVMGRYSVDQIRAAYEALSGGNESSTTTRAPKVRPRFEAAPVEVLDLDDFEFREGGELGARFVRSCRCGAEEGYIIPESLLEEASREDDGEGAGGWSEVEVYCVGCSLRIRVGFQALEDEE